MQIADEPSITAIRFIRQADRLRFVLDGVSRLEQSANRDEAVGIRKAD